MNNGPTNELALDFVAATQAKASKFYDIFGKVIPFFDKYQIEGVKSSDGFPALRAPKKIALLMKEKQHLTPEDLEKIKSLRSAASLRCAS